MVDNDFIAGLDRVYKKHSTYPRGTQRFFVCRGSAFGMTLLPVFDDDIFRSDAVVEETKVANGHDDLLSKALKDAP